MNKISLTTPSVNFRENKQIEEKESTVTQPQVVDEEKSNAAKYMIGATALATVIGLGIAGRKGKLGKNVQEFLGGAKKAGEDAKNKVEQEAKAKAEQEAKEKALQEAKTKAEQEAKSKALQEAKAKAEQEAKSKAEQEAKAKAEQEAKAKAEQEAKAKAEQEAKAKAEQEAKAKAEQEAKLHKYENAILETGFTGKIKAGDSEIIFKDGKIESCIDSNNKPWNFIDANKKYQKEVLSKVKVEKANAEKTIKALLDKSHSLQEKYNQLVPKLYEIRRAKNPRYEEVLNAFNEFKSIEDEMKELNRQLSAIPMCKYSCELRDQYLVIDGIRGLLRRYENKKNTVNNFKQLYNEVTHEFNEGTKTSDKMKALAKSYKEIISLSKEDIGGNNIKECEIFKQEAQEIKNFVEGKMDKTDLLQFNDVNINIDLINEIIREQVDKIKFSDFHGLG